MLALQLLKFRLRLLILSTLVFPALSIADTEVPTDTIKLVPPESNNDLRYAYKLRVLQAAMESTVLKQGEYTLSIAEGKMTAARAFKELADKDAMINTITAIPTPEREALAIPIRIPIRKGLLNYRLLITHKNLLKKFIDIKTFDDLKTLSTGLHYDWITTEVYRDNGLDMQLTYDRSGLLPMLAKKRFDYTLFGVNEAQKILLDRPEYKDELIIVPNIAIYIPMPLYFFVAKSEAKLARRIKKGMENIVKNGTLNNLFEAEYRDRINKADLQSRTIIQIKNTFIPKETPLSRKELWFSPKDQTPKNSARKN